MGLHEALHVKAFTTYGVQCRGLFVKAGSRIKKGEDVWWFDNVHDSLRIYMKEQIMNAPTMPMTFSEINATIGLSSKAIDVKFDCMVPNAKNVLMVCSYMIDDDCFASTPNPDEDTSFYINHSCQPNIGFYGDDKLIALCDIEGGEQVLKDYAFTETQDSFHQSKVCKCGTRNCRGYLDFLQYKDPVYIQQYFSNCSSFIQRKMSEHGWLHDHVVRRIVFEPDGKSKLVYGLFALLAIPEGTNIIIMAGKIVSGKFLPKLDKCDQQMSLQIDKNKWQIPNRVVNSTPLFGSGTNTLMSYESGSYINHSCSPNCGMEDATRVVTMRRIEANEEITIDYAMVRDGALVLEGDVFKCFCGSRDCRGTITPQDYTIIELNNFKYLSPFVQEMCISDMTGGITRRLSTDSAATSEHDESTMSPESVGSDSLRSAFNLSDISDDEGKFIGENDLDDDHKVVAVERNSNIDNEPDTSGLAAIAVAMWNIGSDSENDTSTVVDMHRHNNEFVFGKFKQDE